MAAPSSALALRITGKVPDSSNNRERADNNQSHKSQEELIAKTHDANQ